MKPGSDGIEIWKFKCEKIKFKLEFFKPGSDGGEIWKLKCEIIKFKL